MPSEDLKKIIKTAKVVCFDVDSTVIQEEGIDELAAYQGKGKEVAELTAKLFCNFFFNIVIVLVVLTNSNHLRQCYGWIYAISRCYKR